MRDITLHGKFFIALATEAFENHYDHARKLCNLNPDFQKHWIETAKAVHAALAARAKAKQGAS